MLEQNNKATAKFKATVASCVFNITTEANITYENPIILMPYHTIYSSLTLSQFSPLTSSSSYFLDTKRINDVIREHFFDPYYPLFSSPSIVLVLRSL